MQLFLAKLPRIKDHNQDFFGIGYYEETKFVFALLTLKTIELIPMRFLPIPEYGTEESNQIEILGKIEHIKNP